MKTGHNPGVQRGAAGPDSPGAAMLDRYPAMLPLLSTQQPGMSHPRLGASIIFKRGRKTSSPRFRRRMGTQPGRQHYLLNVENAVIRIIEQ